MSQVDTAMGLVPKKIPTTLAGGFTAPGAPNFTPYSGTLQPQVTYNAFPNPLTQTAYRPASNITPGNHITSWNDYQSEHSINTAYVAKIHSDDTEHLRQLMEKNVLFISRVPQSSAKDPIYDVYNLAQMNKLLKDMYYSALNIIAGADNLTFPANKAAAVKAYLEMPEKLRSDPRHQKTAAELRLGSGASQALNYMTAGLITEIWTVAGVMSNDSGNTGRELKVVNNVAAGIAYVRNHWGKVSIGTSLWLVLTRVYREETDQYEEFAWIPCATLANQDPPTRIREYRDDKGELMYGICYHLGKVVDDPSIQTRSVDNEETLLLSSGRMGRSSAEHHLATQRLTYLKIDIRPRGESKSHWLF